MATYLLTHPNRTTAEIQTVGDSIWGISIDSAPLNRYKHGNLWRELVDAYQGAPGNGYTVTLKALLTLTDFENAPTGTTVTHQRFATTHTKQGPNQWHDAATGETISDEAMAQRGVAYTV